VKPRALVLNAMAENLDALKCGGWGRTGQSGAPPDTVRCASHVTQPLGFDRSSSDNGATGQSGAPSGACSDSMRNVHAL
jgi:hypothetical protein